MAYPTTWLSVICKVKFEKSDSHPKNHSILEQGAGAVRLGQSSGRKLWKQVVLSPVYSFMTVSKILVSSAVSAWNKL